MICRAKSRWHGSPAFCLFQQVPLFRLASKRALLASGNHYHAAHVLLCRLSGRAGSVACSGKLGTRNDSRLLRAPSASSQPSSQVQVVRISHVCISTQDAVLSGKRQSAQCKGAACGRSGSAGHVVRCFGPCDPFGCEAAADGAAMGRASRGVGLSSLQCQWPQGCASRKSASFVVAAQRQHPTCRTLNLATAPPSPRCCVAAAAARCFQKRCRAAARRPALHPPRPGWPCCRPP